ncbi:pyridoxamine 5'-phosphate oxidase family protein [Stappia sp. ES.058]|uniref:pyridoxamine 5'-phosphate oxidase family protein n=1 Tax=Stappia sp. ES.058 TaxID=1881061 RepID=UPI00087BFCEF|nr:pyridoxamine 5'-phosphate oxidase family protein [Stappia sp. ES.058]SDU41705.1 hypothetical protein SAMN05428979_3631 [Stappia sp. ES.058]
MKLNDTVRADIEKSVLCWLASVDPSGFPSVSPKEIWTVFDDTTLVVADIASNNSVRNILKHPAVCLSFVDIFRQRGFKIQGHADIIAPHDPDFARLGPGLAAMAGETFKIRHIIRIDVQRIARILAPSYRLDPDIDEDTMMKQAFATYGVRPA